MLSFQSVSALILIRKENITEQIYFYLEIMIVFPVGILKNKHLRETQSCEILDQNQQLPVRKTVSMASSAKIKQDSNILRNIKK